MAKSKVIAIDGPSGSGKSTVAKKVAANLELTYLDTGAMFRAIALYLTNKEVTSAETKKIAELLEKLQFEYQPEESVLIRLDGGDLTEKIREHHVSQLASKYSQVTEIRNYLKKMQRAIASVRPSILEGRDIGTVIFPDAALKIFLTAKPEVRAQRRLEELRERSPNESYEYQVILNDIIKRDQSDQNRAVAPLVKADDAVEIDTSDKTIKMIIEEITSLFQERKKDFY